MHMSVRYKRAEYHGAVLSNQVPIHCSLLMEDYLKDLWDNARRLTTRLYPIRFFRPFQRNLTLNRALFEEVLEELLQEYHGAVLSNEVPSWSSSEMEDYPKALWATARQVTKKRRRKVVTKHDIMSALYDRRSPLEPGAHPLQSPNGGLFEGLECQRTPGD
ncbi:hypothetical protein CEXT_63601 [Caerostris extrusa]|uniref:Transposase n=1 Tax=Caerostris extrusa TaxID=172846 RepID=A0AAV4MFC0_CAEEX|nr:hypothetical protein CEXT_63601 [Caerostris extrusa]